jgi:hypothetical protein
MAEGPLYTTGLLQGSFDGGACAFCAGPLRALCTARRQCRCSLSAATLHPEERA